MRKRSAGALRELAVRSCGSGGGARECEAGADSVRRGGVASTLKSLRRSGNDVREKQEAEEEEGV